MEIKKSPKADLQNKRGLLLEIGLIIALGGVIAAFAWTPKEQKIEKLDLNIAPVEEEIMEITRQEQKPPEPPKKTEITVITDILKVVTNDTKITTNVDFAEFEDDVEIVQQVAVEEEEIVEEQPFLVAETMPSFQGGSLNDFRNWVQSPGERYFGQGGADLRHREGRPSDQHSGAPNAGPLALGRGDPRIAAVSEMVAGQAAQPACACEVHPACGIPHPAVNLHRPPETVPRTVRPSEVRINNKGIFFRGIPFFSMRLEL